MSEATAKAARRQLRRAMGEEAVSVVNKHAEALNALPAKIDSAFQWERAKTDEQFRELRAMHNTLAQEVAWERAWLGVSFWSRLRWLFTGYIAPRVIR